jgi:hypothetical protein
MRQKLRQQIDAFYEEGVALLMSELTEHRQPTTRDEPPIQATYQNWYSKALGLVWRLLPERYEEFRQLYSGEGRAHVDHSTYSISDFLMNVPLPRHGANEPRAIFASKFHLQLSLLGSARERIDAHWVELERTVELQLLNVQLQAAIRLFGQGQLRAAGALTSVILQAELRLACQQAGLTLETRESDASTFNDALQGAGLTDANGWRYIHRLCLLSDACVEGNGREPAATEVEELITGTRHVQTLFA